ncbi:MAG TPA: hypothetical protein PKL00_10245 [Bacillota bacterium]|jgi:hypothetical protein|nr:hypothetical protein [Bacillota bacterium]HQE10960.1 hypothetical protein [Bacillota bacterium]
MSSGWPFLFVGVHYALIPLFAFLQKNDDPYGRLVGLKPGTGGQVFT